MAPLPISRREVALRHPDGGDELSLREAAGPPVRRALALLERLAPGADIGELCVTDFEILLLRLRQSLIGEAFDLGFACPCCGERVEVSFRLGDFLASVRPRRAAAAGEAPGRPGWYVCEDHAFRLPTAADLDAVAGRADAAAALAERCIDPPVPRGRLRARVERAMAALAPEVSRPLAGACPACGAAVSAPLHVTALVVGELARESAGLHDEVDLIARAYHWPEADILNLPRRRRQAYADRIRQAA